MANVDGDTRPGPIYSQLGKLPGRLNAENLPAEFAVVQGARLESGPDASLPKPLNPGQTLKCRKKHLYFASIEILQGFFDGL